MAEITDTTLHPPDSAFGPDGFNRFGFDRDGYGRSGYNRSGYDRGGYDRGGYDRSGYNRSGYNQFGSDRDGYNRYGYNRDGFDRDGYNRDGYDADGLNRDGSPKPAASELDLPALWTGFSARHGQNPYWGTTQDAFLAYLRTLVRDPDAISGIMFCDGCLIPGWNDSMLTAGDDTRICRACWDSWRDCDRCGRRYHNDDLSGTLSGYRVCESCRDSYYSFCEDCDGYYQDADADDHDHHPCNDGSCCSSPQQDFAVRNDGTDPLKNDTRVTITLPAGVISPEGLGEIRDYLYRQYRYSTTPGASSLGFEIAALGDQWQTKAGNYTKRLSSLAYKTYKLKLTPDIMSRIGDIARDHSKQVDVAIEITRDLNQDPAYFCNSGSCWWDSYSYSRCTLKTNGGFGLRTFSPYGSVRGRAWVLPLKRNGRQLVPTFNTLTPAAYVVFNGYGNLSEYAAPRIMAHLAGWTYRRIVFYCSQMYVNSESGYLVAPEDLTQQYTDRRLELSLQQHSRLFATEQAEQAALEEKKTADAVA